MGKYRALYVSSPFKGMDYRVVGVLLDVVFVIVILCISANFFAKKEDFYCTSKDWLLFSCLVIIFTFSFGLFCKNTGEVEIIDTRTGKKTVVVDEKVADKTLRFLRTIDSGGELNKEKDPAEEAVREMLNK